MLLYLLPLAVFVLIIVLLALGLCRAAGRGDRIARTVREADASAESYESKS